MRNLFEQFAATAERFAACTAVEVQRREGLESVSYAELRRWAEKAAAWLHLRGVRPGDRCAILAENDARWCAAFYAILRGGGVAVPFDTNYKATQVATLLENCGARVLFTSPRFLEASRQATPGVSTATELVLLHGRAGGLASLDDILTEELPSPPDCPATPADPALIMYTSGTTSDPKGVVLTHGNWLALIKVVPSAIWVDENDTLLGVLPLFHALPLVVNLLLPFALGARVVFLETVNTTEMMRAFAERNITVFCCVPQFFYLIRERVLKEVEKGGRLKRVLFRLALRLNGGLRALFRLNMGRALFAPVHKVFGPRMRLLVSGGSRFDPAIQRDFYRLGIDILQGYGLTECCGPATVTRPGDRAFGSVGLPLPGVEVKILPREPGAEGENRDGEVAIRGPLVMQGYFNRPDATTAAVRQGWLHSGDLGYLDARGRLFITGRMKDVIVLSSGKNIYPEEIEAHYLQSSYIKEICVLGLARADHPEGERLHAVVAPNFELMRERKVVNTKEILRYEIENLSVQLPSHKRVLSYEVWSEELPRTTTRKLKRHEIEARVREGKQAAETAAAGRAISPQDAAWMADPVTARALEVIGQAAKRKDGLHPDANIELELGLDSMERVELLTSLQMEFGNEVPDEVASRIYTVRELVEAVRPSAAGAARGEVARTPAWDELLRAPLNDPDIERLLKPRPVLDPLMFVGIKLMYLAMKLLFRFRVEGREHLPASGPFLICPNHQSYLDAFFVVAALPYRTFRQVFWVGASEYFATPVMRWAAWLVRLIPVDPDVNLVRAMQASAYGLRQGKVLVLFPEGERSIDGTVKKFKKGASILSQHLQVPIVPVALDGLQVAWPRGKRFQKFSRVRARFGPAVPPSGGAGAGIEAETQYAALAEQLRALVEAMWLDLHQRRLA